MIGLGPDKIANTILVNFVNIAKKALIDFFPRLLDGID